METAWSAWTWSESYIQYYRYRMNAFGQTETEWQAPQTAQPSSVGSTQGSYRRTQQEGYQEGEDTPTNRRSHETQYSNNSYGSSSDFSYGQQPSPTSSDQYATPVTSQFSSSVPASTSLHGLRQDQNYFGQHPGTNQAPVVPQYQSYDVPSTARTPSKATLDAKFQKIPTKKLLKFFVPGRVFSTLWPEPAGVKTDANEQDAQTIAKFGENMFVEVRRFVVIKPFSHHSLCVPISTHQGRGIVGRNADHYSIIFTGAAQALPGENFVKYNIEVIPEDGEELSPTSRVNYAQTYTVQHNVKVRELGKVVKDHMSYVKQYWAEFTQST